MTATAQGVDRKLILNVPFGAMRQRKHTVVYELPNGHVVTCGGKLVPLYARVNGELRSVGAVCDKCSEVRFDGNPEEVWRPGSTSGLDLFLGDAEGAA